MYLSLSIYIYIYPPTLANFGLGRAEPGVTAGVRHCPWALLWPPCLTPGLQTAWSCIFPRFRNWRLALLVLLGQPLPHSL